MKPYIRIQIKSFFLNFGWFSGNEWELFKLELLTTFEGYGAKFLFVTIFGVQILKFAFDFGFDL